MTVLYTEKLPVKYVRQGHTPIGKILLVLPLALVIEQEEQFVVSVDYVGNHDRTANTNPNWFRFRISIGVLGCWK